MPATGVFGDLAGGPVIAAAQQWMYLSNKLTTVITDRVKPHGDGVHLRASMAQGSPWMFLMGLNACRTGDLATCGHAIVGSQNWFAIDVSEGGSDGGKGFAKHMICNLGKAFYIDPELRKQYLALLQKRRKKK